MKILIFIAYLCGVFLVPLPPACLLYMFLPSKTSVSGPFKGLKINLQGAFAGYFLLVLLAFSFAFFVLTPSKPCYEIWQLTGQFEAKSIDPNASNQTNDIVGTTIGVTPPNYTVDTGGEFGMTIMVIPGHVEGQRKYPTLVFNRPGYTARVLRLNAADINIDKKTKAIRLKQKVTLERLKEETEKPKPI